MLFWLLDVIGLKPPLTSANVKCFLKNCLDFLRKTSKKAKKTESYTKWQIHATTSADIQNKRTHPYDTLKPLVYRLGTVFRRATCPARVNHLIYYVYHFSVNCLKVLLSWCVQIAYISKFSFSKGSCIIFQSFFCVKWHIWIVLLQHLQCLQC